MRRPLFASLSTPLLRLSCVAAVGLAAVGCHEFHRPRWDASDYALLPIPFREMGVTNGWYGWSPNGAEVIRGLREWTERNLDSPIVSDMEGKEVLRKVYNWKEDEIRPKDWAMITRGETFDIVLVGEIVRLSFKEPNDVNLHRGRARFRYKIHQVGTGKVLYRSGDREVFYPRRQEIDIPINVIEFQNRREEIERGLLSAIGVEIGKDLYGYYD